MSILDTNSLLQQTVAEAAEVAGYIWQKGWGERNGGNLTIDVTDRIPSTYQPTSLGESRPLGMPLTSIANRYFYVKGTGCRMRDLSRQPMHNGCIIRISQDGLSYQMVADEPVVPTSELPSHLLVQNYLRQSGSQYTATLHTHPIELVALSHSRSMLDDSAVEGAPNLMTRTLWSMIPETLAFAPLGIGIVPYQLPGSQILADATLRQIQHFDVVLWEKHGVFAVGKDLMDAFDQVDVLNKAARIYLDAKHIVDQPEGMTIPAMKEVQQVFQLPTSRPC